MVNREVVILRDKGLCVNCGKAGIEVHHIIPNTKLNKKLYGDQLESMENLVLVCKNCHNNHSLWDKPLRNRLKSVFTVNSKIKTSHLEAF